MGPHEKQMGINAKRFLGKVSGAGDDVDKIDASSKLIQLFNNYEDYITKSRQANHAAFLAYAPIITAVASVLIALSLGGFTIYSYWRPGPNVDGIIQVIQASDKETVVSNLRSFQDAGLITLSEKQIAALAKVSMKKQ